MIMKKIFSTVIALMATLAVSAQTTREYVDLDLPSGTLWATCNVGANAPEESGDYFAWGETSPKETYDWSTYKWCNGSYNTLTKYCTGGMYGTVDDQSELLPEDDAATANWGSEWRMPTIDQLKELYDYTTTEWTTVNGVNGCLITSKQNGNTLFLPAAGYCDTGSLNLAGSYWSRSLHWDDYAYCPFFWSGGVGWSYLRYYGNSVRPVRSKGKSTTSIDGITDNQKAAKNRKYISGGNLVIEKDGKQYNVNGAKAK